MRKIIFFIAILMWLSPGLVRSDTIDAITVISEDPFVVGIKGAYADGCGRNTLLETMTVDNQVKISIFTQTFYPPGFPCPNQGSPEFYFTQEITPPSGGFEIIVSLYVCPNGFDAEGTLIASRTLQIGYQDEPPPPPPVSDESSMSFMTIHPKIINMKRNGKEIMGKFNFPEGYNSEDVVGDSIVLGLKLEDGQESRTVPAVKFKTMERKLFVKFDSADIIQLIREVGISEFPSRETFFVRGNFLDQSSFSGACTVMLIDWQPPAHTEPEADWQLAN